MNNNRDAVKYGDNRRLYDQYRARKGREIEGTMESPRDIKHDLDYADCLHGHGVAVKYTVNWSESDIGSSITSGAYPTLAQAMFAAYLSAFRMGMPFPSIRRHWWQIWRREYSAGEIEIMKWAWKKSCRSQSLESDRQTNLTDMDEQQ